MLFPPTIVHSNTFSPSVSRFTHLQTQTLIHNFSKMLQTVTKRKPPVSLYLSLTHTHTKDTSFTHSLSQTHSEHPLPPSSFSHSLYTYKRPVMIPTLSLSLSLSLSLCEPPHGIFFYLVVMTRTDGFFHLVNIHWLMWAMNWKKFNKMLFMLPSTVVNKESFTV